MLSFTSLKTKVFTPLITFPTRKNLVFIASIFSRRLVHTLFETTSFFLGTKRSNTGSSRTIWKILYVSLSSWCFNRRVACWTVHKGAVASPLRTAWGERRMTQCEQSGGLPPRPAVCQLGWQPLGPLGAQQSPDVPGKGKYLNVQKNLRAYNTPSCNTKSHRAMNLSNL